MYRGKMQASRHTSLFAESVWQTICWWPPELWFKIEPKIRSRSFYIKIRVRGMDKVAQTFRLWRFRAESDGETQEAQQKGEWKRMQFTWQKRKKAETRRMFGGCTCGKLAKWGRVGREERSWEEERRGFERLLWFLVMVIVFEGDYIWSIFYAMARWWFSFINQRTACFTLICASGIGGRKSKPEGWLFEKFTWHILPLVVRVHFYFFVQHCFVVSAPLSIPNAINLLSRKWGCNSMFQESEVFVYSEASNKCVCAS